MTNLNSAPAGNTAVSTFNFRGFDLRCIKIDDAPWFCARDIADTLGIVNVTNMLANLQKTEVSAKKLSEATRARPNKIVNERGFYEIVSRAHKSNPKAREFQDWVFGTVLPSIRKDGGYIEGEEKVASGDMSEDELVLKAMDVMRRKIDRLAAENEAMHDELTQVSVAEYADTDTSFTKEATHCYEEVYRMEARIGAQIALNPNLPPAVRDNLVMETRGRILRHVYGPVEAEVRAALYSLYDAGLHGGDPAVDRLAALLDTFGRAFRGEVAA